MNNYSFTAKSSNIKTGKIPVTVAPRKTCPDNCPHKDNGCYYESGFFTKLHWNKLDNGERGKKYNALLSDIEKINADIWRHLIGGDLNKNKKTDTINATDLKKLVSANNKNKSRFNIAYAHFNPMIKQNRILIEYANNNGFTLNLSADSFKQVDKYMALDIAPVVTTLPIRYQRKTDRRNNFIETKSDYKKRLKTLKTVTDNGNKILVCPAVNSDTITCKDCKLCARNNRKVVIGFPAHGTSKNKLKFKDIEINSGE